MYRLTRVSPSGAEKELGPFTTVLDAAAQARRMLVGYKLATPVEARWFASYLSGLPLGMDAVHAVSKYAFRIECAEDGEQS
jgi:hypothetical protein